MTESVTTMGVIFGEYFPLILLFIGLIIIYFIIREFRLMWTKTRTAQLDLEREKINLLKADMEMKGRPYFRVPPEKLQEIKSLDDENTELNTEIFAQQSAVEKRIQRLESKVKLTKLDHMIEKIKREEDRLG